MVVSSKGSYAVHWLNDKNSLSHSRGGHLWGKHLFDWEQFPPVCVFLRGGWFSAIETTARHWVINFMTTLFWEVSRDSNPMRTRNTSRFPKIPDIVVLLAPHMTEPNRLGDAIWSLVDCTIWSLVDCTALSRRYSQQESPSNISWNILVTRPNCNRNLSIRRWSDSRLNAFTNVTALLRSVMPWTFRKIPSLPLALEMPLGLGIFKTLPKIHEHRWGSESRPI